MEACLQRKEQKNRKAKKFDGAAEARLTAVACSDPPEGRECWTLKLLADEMVALEIVDSVCRETVRKTLKNVLKPWLQEMWCIPGGVSADYVCAMEDVLDVYHKPYDPRHPVVCMDETIKQLIAEIESVYRQLPVNPHATRINTSARAWPVSSCCWSRSPEFVMSRLLNAIPRKIGPCSSAIWSTSTFQRPTPSP